MLKILASCFKADICLLPIFVIEIVGVGLSMATVAASYDDILGKGRLAGKKLVVLKTFSIDVLGMYDVRKR